MKGTIADLSARMNQRAQRLAEEQRILEQKQRRYTTNPDAISEISEMEPSQQTPKPKRRQHRTPSKSPFDDDSSVQFSYHDGRSNSSATTASTTPRAANKFLKKPAPIPVTSEKISVTRSPRDARSPRTSNRPASNTKSGAVGSVSKTGLISQSALLARAARRQDLYAKGIEMEPGVLDRDSDEDESNSDKTMSSGSKILFGSARKSFLKKKAPTATEVPELQHLDSESNLSDQDAKKAKNKKKPGVLSVHDTEDDSILDFIGDGSSSEGRKTPTLTPRKSILKTPRDSNLKESERSVQFSADIHAVQSDEERLPTPTRSSRNATPRHVRIVSAPVKEEEEPSIVSESESISTAIDVADDDKENGSISENIAQSPLDNVFENIVMDSEFLKKPITKKKSPRRTSPRVVQKKTTSPVTKFNQTVSNISESDRTLVEEIEEDFSAANYSDDFTTGQTDSSTPRPVTPTKVRTDRLTKTKTVTTDDHEVQVDMTSAPFQSSLNHVHSIYLINQSNQDDTRPSSLIRSVVEPHVLQSLLTTNPVLLAVDDLIREQSSLLRSFIHLQRTYYESTVRSIRPEHIYTTKENSLQFIADAKQSRMPFQPNEDSISH